MIFDIQRFSIHDGAGIRTLVFFKGCPLHCPWCENPESQSYQSELFYDSSKCIGCLECTRVEAGDGITAQDGKIHIDREKIKDPQAYRNVCPAGALRVVGQEKSVEEILREIEKDRPFYRHSGGGVTISGGEPYGQPKLLLELLQALKQREIDTAVETSLQARWEDIEPTIDLIDTFLADLKHMDPEALRAYTGGDLDRILENFRALDRRSANLVVRVPVIPGFNDSDEVIAAIIAFSASLHNVREIDFLPYHTLGMNKYFLMGREYEYSSRLPDWDGRLDHYTRMAEQKGLITNIGG
jgi:pyruvate formate lyase activating enzyme